MHLRGQGTEHSCLHRQRHQSPQLPSPPPLPSPVSTAVLLHTPGKYIGTTSATSTAAGHTLSRHWFRACTSAGQDDDERTRPRSTRPRRPRVLDQRVFAERVLAAHVHDDQSQDPICIRTVCARPIRVKTGNAGVTAPPGKASSATLLPACPSFTPGRSALAPSAPKSKG